jgi:hypothetical protein
LSAQSIPGEWQSNERPPNVESGFDLRDEPPPTANLKQRMLDQVPTIEEELGRLKALVNQLP